MRTLVSVILLITVTMNVLSQNSQVDRNPAVAGSFYPDNKDTLTKDLAKYFATCVKAPSDLRVRAIISPHAGYVFSGIITASAFSALPKDADYKNIFIIGSSHYMAFDGASIYNTGDYITPLGKMKVNIELANKLKSNNRCFNFPVTAHEKEHSIEVQVPFIQYYFKNEIPIIPIIIGADNTSTIKEIAAALKPYFIPENLFVISSDFSHYPSYKDARENDKITADAIISKNSNIFLMTLEKNSSKGIPGLVTSMCGWTSGLTLLYLAEKDPNLTFRKICYCNSGDSPYGNKVEVVGYNAIELVENNKKAMDVKVNMDELKFTKEETEELISIARNSIRSMLFDNKRLTIEPRKIFRLFSIRIWEHLSRLK